jgi:uncharacterized protein
MDKLVNKIVNMIKIFLKIVASFLFFTSCTSAQQKSNNIIFGEKLTIQSEILNESRQLMVYTPEKVLQKVPLILVFDAESLFETTVAAVKFMSYSSEIPQMPEAIVVGIPNTNRDRDMPTPQQYGVGNGEKNFMDFIKQELIPWVNKKYQLNGHIIAIGHSQGALFVSYLMSEEPETFSWAIALDAPMNIDTKTNRLKAKLTATINEQKIKSRYASIESVFGWGSDWEKSIIKNVQAMQMKLPDETHESMPFKGIYEGLSFLFKDFAPVRKDLSLTALKEYYKLVSEKYGHTYEIPQRVLTASASRKIIEGRKKEILELIDYAEIKYAVSERTTRIKSDANKIMKEPDSIIDSILALPKPSAEQISKYKGRWVGQKMVPKGQAMQLDLEIIAEDGKVKLLMAIPWNPSKKEEADFLHITKEGKLVFGRVNRGGGLFVSTCTIDKNGKLTGEEWLIGFNIPDNETADFKEVMNFVLKNPNTFSLIKQ